MKHEYFLLLTLNIQLVEAVYRVLLFHLRAFRSFRPGAICESKRHVSSRCCSCGERRRHLRQMVGNSPPNGDFELEATDARFLLASLRRATANAPIENSMTKVLAGAALARPEQQTHSALWLGTQKWQKFLSKRERDLAQKSAFVVGPLHCCPLTVHY